MPPEEMGVAAVSILAIGHRSIPQVLPPKFAAIRVIDHRGVLAFHSSNIGETKQRQATEKFAVLTVIWSDAIQPTSLEQKLQLTWHQSLRRIARHKGERYMEGGRNENMVRTADNLPTAGSMTKGPRINGEK